jgi:hypothetical protein
MVALLWAFAGYTFPVECQPSGRQGAGEWNRALKSVIHQPINSDTDVITDFGFTSRRRTIEGDCTQAFRNQMRTFFNNKTIGNLVDGEGQSQSARIQEQDFKEVLPGLMYRYTMTFIAR